MADAGDYLNAVEDVDRPVALVDDIVQRVELSDETVRQRMEELAEEGAVESDRVSGRWIFWCPD